MKRGARTLITECNWSVRCQEVTQTKVLESGHRVNRKQQIKRNTVHDRNFRRPGRGLVFSTGSGEYEDFNDK